MVFPTITHLERDHQVDLLPDSPDICLSEMARKTDLGLFCNKKEKTENPCCADTAVEIIFKLAVYPFPLSEFFKGSSENAVRPNKLLVFIISQLYKEKAR